MIVAWMLSIIVLMVFVSCGSIMPLASLSLADRILMFLPFFSMSPYVPFVSNVSSVTSPPNTVASLASSYSVSVCGNVASRLMYAAVSLSAVCMPAS